MSQSNSMSAQNTFNISNSPITNVTGSGDIHYYETLETTDDLSNPKKIILFLAANPLATHQLRLGEEVREIEAGLQRSKYRDHFELKQQWAVRPKDLQRAMLDYRPQIIHFSGHGIDLASHPQLTETVKGSLFADKAEMTESGLILEDASGQLNLVSTEALTNLFGLFADESIDCVVLNACYSKQQAQAIAQHIPYVIGMSQAIKERTAIEFSVGFYGALGAGKSIEAAYKLGCNMIQLSGLSEHLIPVIVSQSIERH